MSIIIQVAQSNAKATNSVRKRSTVNDLPFEILLIIYEGVDLAELSGIATLNSFHYRADETALNLKMFGEKLLVNENGLNVEYDDDNLENLCDIKTTFLVSTIFGHLISNLSISYEKITALESSILNELLSKCLANSLNEIEIN